VSIDDGRNIAVITYVRDLIRENPDRHDQLQWLYVPGPWTQQCGSTGCVAGHAALFAGLVRWDKGDYVRVGRFDEWGGAIVMYSDANLWTAAGAEALGINRDLALELFDDDVTRDDVLWSLNELIAGTPQGTIMLRLADAAQAREVD